MPETSHNKKLRQLATDLIALADAADSEGKTLPVEEKRGLHEWPITIIHRGVMVEKPPAPPRPPRDATGKGKGKRKDEQDEASETESSSANGTPAGMRFGGGEG